MNLLTRLLVMVAAAMGFALPAAAQPSFPERGTAPVVDEANIIDDATEADLTRKLEAFEEANQRQFVVATVPDLQGYDIADYGYQLGRFWQLGDADHLLLHPLHPRLADGHPAGARAQHEHARVHLLPHAPHLLVRVGAAVRDGDWAAAEASWSAFQTEADTVEARAF